MTFSNSDCVSMHEPIQTRPNTPMKRGGEHEVPPLAEGLSKWVAPRRGTVTSSRMLLLIVWSCFSKGHISKNICAAHIGLDGHTHTHRVGCVGSREQGYLGEVEMRRGGCNKKHIVGRSQRTANKQNYGSLRMSKVVSLHLCKSCCVSFPRSHGRPLPSSALFPSDLLVRIFAELLTP